MRRDKRSKQGKKREDGEWKNATASVESQTRSLKYDWNIVMPCLIWIANSQNLHFVHIPLFYYFERWSKYLRLGKNWHACAVVLWMFCPPSLRAGHVTDNYQLHLSVCHFYYSVQKYLCLGLDVGVGLTTIKKNLCYIVTIFFLFLHISVNCVLYHFKLAN